MITLLPFPPPTWMFGLMAPSSLRMDREERGPLFFAGFVLLLIPFPLLLAPTSSCFSELCATSFSLDWVLSHLNSCSFSSIRLFSDSQSSLSLLRSGPSLLLSQTLSSICSALSGLGRRGVAVHLQWTPAHCDIPGNERADQLAKKGAQLSPSQTPVPFSSAVCLSRSSIYRDWRSSVSSPLFPFPIPPVDPSELSLSRSARVELSRLRAGGHSLLLESYRHRIGKSDSPACACAWAHICDLPHLLLSCPRFEPSRSTLLAPSPSLLDLWRRPTAVADLLGFGGCPGPPDSPP